MPTIWRNRPSLPPWQQTGRFRRDGGVAAWLLTIAWSKFLMADRARRRAGSRDAAWLDGVDTVIAPAQEAAIDHDRVLAALGSRERAALVLTLGHGYTHDEAAAIVAVPLGTLKSLAARGRAQAATMLSAAMLTEAG